MSTIIETYKNMNNYKWRQNSLAIWTLAFKVWQAWIQKCDLENIFS